MYQRVAVQDGVETVDADNTTLSSICIEQNDKVSNSANQTISDMELPINPPKSEMSLCVILPCYRESEDELRLSLNNYLWKHTHRTTTFMKRNVFIPYEKSKKPDKINLINKEYVEKFNQMINGMLLLIVVDGNMDFEQESDTLKAIKTILGIEQVLSEWKEAINCKFYEAGNVFGERCKIVVIVKGIPGFAGKRYSQSLGCRVLMNLTDKYPHLMQLKYLLLVDADTGFRISDLYKSIKIMKDNDKAERRIGGIQIYRRMMNFSWLNFVTLVQNYEFHSTGLKRQIISGLGYLIACDGPYILLSYEAMTDIINDFSVCIVSSDPRNACKCNAANLGEDGLMARLVTYHGHNMEQITDPDINNYINCVETFYELFDQRRRWFNNSLSHTISNCMCRFEKKKINFTYEPWWRIIVYLLYLLTLGSEISLFTGPSIYIFLWSITCKIIYPQLDIIYYFITFVGFMILHGIISYKQRPISRKHWINFVCFVCMFLTFVSWLRMLYSLIAFFLFDESNRYAFGYVFFVCVSVAQMVVSTISYCILFGIYEWHQILFSMLIFWFILGGHAIYDFGINIWTISNYFDTRWGTRENAKDQKDKNHQTQSNKFSFLFPNLSDNPRQGIFGISMCYPQFFQFLMPISQYLSSAIFAFFSLRVIEHRLVDPIYIYTIPIAPTIVCVLLLISARMRTLSYSEE